MYLPDYFRWGTQTYVMGVINVTPDSFSGDGILDSSNIINDAVSTALSFVNNGAHLIDVGGESTRPGNKPTKTTDELDRVIPVIEALSSCVSVPISIDTTKSDVANAALSAGATIVNDVSGLKYDKKMAGVVSEHNAALVIMHNNSIHQDVETNLSLGNRYKHNSNHNLFQQMIVSLNKSLSIALKSKVQKQNIIIDPGIGFGKSVEQDCQLINQLQKLKPLNYPLLIGPSRKSFIGYTLDLPVEDRLEGTAASISVGISNGADIIRVHDVKYMSRIAKMTDAIVRI